MIKHILTLLLNRFTCIAFASFPLCTKEQYIHKANHRRCSTIRFTGSIDRTNDNHLYLCSTPSTLIAQLFTCCLSKIPWSMTAAGIARTFSSNYLSFLPLHLCHLFIRPSALPYYMNAKISKQRTRRWKNSIREIIQINFGFIVSLIQYNKTIIVFLFFNPYPANVENTVNS